MNNPSAQSLARDGTNPPPRSCAPAVPLRPPPNILRD